MTDACNDLTAARRHLTAGQLNAAEATCRNFLKGDPYHVGALKLLGTIQCKRGDLRQAATSIDKAISLQPDDAALHRHLGDIHFLAGDLDQSIDRYRHALRLAPDDPEVPNNLGVALRKAGKLDEAIIVLKDALQRRPELSLPYKNLGEVFRLQGKLDMAIDQYKTALRLDPRDATSLNSIGLILVLQGKQAAAISRFEEALKLNPEFAEVENNLANTLSAIGRFDEALTHGRNALRLRPRFANAHITLGNILKLQGQNDEAVEKYKQALELDQRNVVAHQSLGSVLTDLGRFDAAVVHLEEALRLEPNLFAAYQNLVALAVQDKYQFSSQQLDRIKMLLESNDLAPGDASRLHFTMGSLLNKNGDYDAAMRSYQQANNLQMDVLRAAGLTFDRNQFCRQIDETISVFQPAAFENLHRGGLDSEIPVFVVGMPRSGTTLVEQIIASHPRATGAGELSYIPKLTEELPMLTGGEEVYPQCIMQAESAQIAGLARHYLDRLVEIAPDALRVIDKLPGNFLHLGFISLLFPNARIIHCRRNTMDVCLSCYLCDFGAVRWAWQLEDIGFYHYQYQRLMEHWRQVLPLELYEIDYEQLVADHKTVSHDLISFCGLDWNDQCLEFYKGDRAVQTLSRVQVRQPIYNTSIGRWKHYEKYLEPLTTALKGDTTGD